MDACWLYICIEYFIYLIESKTQTDHEIIKAGLILCNMGLYSYDYKQQIKIVPDPDGNYSSSKGIYG